MKLAEKWYWTYSQTVCVVKTRFNTYFVRANINAFAGQEFRRGKFLIAWIGKME